MRKQTVCQGTVKCTQEGNILMKRSWKQGESLVQKNTNKENSLDKKYLSGKGQEEHSMEKHEPQKEKKKIGNSEK